MTKPIVEPTLVRTVAGQGWWNDQLERRPPVGSRAVAIDSDLAYNVSIEEASVIYNNPGDSNAYWDSATCVNVTYTWRPTALLTQPITGVAVGLDPDTTDPTIFLAAGSGSVSDPTADSPIANLWQIQTPMCVFEPLFGGSTGLDSVWAKATLFAFDGTANSFTRSQTDEIFSPHLESEANVELNLGFVADFLAANPAITGSDPAAPLRVFYAVEVKWFINTPFVDWTPGDEDDIAAANVPTDTRFYVNLLAQVTP